MGFACSAFHGGLEQRQREDALYKFSNGSATVLVATDLASRGLDIPHIDNIIHYHLPMTEESLIHRVGRTARWDALGKTFFLIGPEEHLPEFASAGCQVFELQSSSFPVPVPQMTTIYIGKGKKDKISKGDIVGFLCKKGGLEPSEVGHVDVSDRYAYAAICRTKLQQVLRLTRNEKIKGVRTVVEPVK
jgi:superfamily II DNA/RNA helicase